MVNETPKLSPNGNEATQGQAYEVEGFSPEVKPDDSPNTVQKKLSLMQIVKERDEKEREKLRKSMKGGKMSEIDRFGNPFQHTNAGLATAAPSQYS